MMETKKAEKTRLVEWAYPSHVQLKLQRWGKEKKNIWEIFFETQESLSSNVWTLLYVWM